MSVTIRVPATTVQLVQILGVILRDRLKLRLHNTECWTFEHVKDWAIPKPVETETADDPDWWGRWMLSGGDEHQMSVYLASGNCLAFGFGSDPGNAKRVELRVRCEHSEWVDASLSFWDFQIWLKAEGESVVREHFVCHLGYGRDRDIYEEKISTMSENPPRKIAFWKKEQVIASTASL